MLNLPHLQCERKTGDEAFTLGEQSTGVTVLDFWRWSASNLLSNVTRGVLAEFLVAKALGIEGIRTEWAPCDLTMDDGTLIEVKCSAYLQAWKQLRPSAISFGIKPTRKWDPETGVMDAEPCRAADVYVFALLAETDSARINPLDLDQWRFYVLGRAQVDGYERSKHSITLPSLERVSGGSCGFAELRSRVEGCRNRC